MIISLMVGSEIIKLRVDDDRRLFLAGKLTNNAFLPFAEAVRRSGQEGSSADMTEKIVRCLPSLDDVEWYVIDEFRRDAKLQVAGVRHLGTER